MRTPRKARKGRYKANEQNGNMENELKVMEKIRHLTNFTNNKALRFEQTSPLAVLLYSFGTQFVHSALFCVHPTGAVAKCYSPCFIFPLGCEAFLQKTPAYSKAFHDSIAPVPLWPPMPCEG